MMTNGTVIKRAFPLKESTITFKDSGLNNNFIKFINAKPYLKY